MSDEANADAQLTPWLKGQAEARKRFGPAKPKADTDVPADYLPRPATGAAAGLAEAQKRFGKRAKSSPTK